jgi:asparagine N-glycosylation enzyme membrane subunit Stt3
VGPVRSFGTTLDLVPTKTPATVLGALTGLVTLMAMLRLISGAFSAGMSHFALVFGLAAMVPWVGYVAWRARHGRLNRRASYAVVVLDVAGLVLVWWFTSGAVAALGCSFAAFVVIWVNDLPVRQPRGEDRFVRIEELQRDDPD